MFAFNIRIQINNVTVGAYTDVARYGRIYILFHRSMGNYKINVNTPANLASSFSVSIFGPFSNVQVSGGQQIGTNQGNCLSYSSKGN